jgi:hypothetical protein
VNVLDCSIKIPKTSSDNKRQNKTTLLQTSSVFLKENNLQDRSSPAALCSIPFSNAVGEKYIFLNHRNGFCECDVLEFVLVFLKKSLESYSYFVGR